MRLTLLTGGLAAILLSGCGESPSKAPTDGEAVRQRALDAQTARRRTGAEVQERALNRTIRAVYICANSERLTVDFDNPRQMATVRTSSGIAIDLYQQRTGEGIWYMSSGHELRGKGVNATWLAGDAKSTECRAID